LKIKSISMNQCIINNLINKSWVPVVWI